MRDVKIEEIADKVAREYGIPKRVARKLTNHMFRYIFNVMKKNKGRVIMMRSDMMQVYKDYDVEHLCMEMIEGKRKNYNQVFTQKSNRIHRKFIRQPRFHLLSQ